MKNLPLDWWVKGSKNIWNAKIKIALESSQKESKCCDTLDRIMLSD